MARQQLLTILLAVLLVLSGCSSVTESETEPPTQSPDSTITQSSSNTATTAETETNTVTATSVPTATAVPRLNPFDSETITVGVSAPTNQTVNFTAIAEDAVSHWQTDRESASRYREDPVQLEFAPDASNPDLLLNFHPTIIRCAGEYSSDTFLFCTERVTSDSVIKETLTLNVSSRYTSEDTEMLAREALAGIYGYEVSDYNSWEVNSPSLRDPWTEKDTVIVGVDSSSNSDRDISPLVRDSLEYWSNSSYGDYDIIWEYRPNAQSPDIEVELVESIDDCGYSISPSTTLGCAPRLSQTEPADNEIQVRITDGYTDDSTTDTIKHEFGHILGLGHGVEPMPLMAASGPADRQPITDARNRSIGWQEVPITVGITSSASSDLESQTKAVVEHLQNSPSQPDDLVIEYVGINSDADIVVREDPGSECDLEHGSCPSFWGDSPDADDALEYYTSGTIYIKDLEGDVTGWHIGYWIDRYASPLDNDEVWDEDDDDQDGWD
ncbi:hypothetical protein [Haloarchaeobius sp. DFWS5]|uniref:hypothetical protein n=1 Tax=Haloarchaeobius sp. DFWS5 TaxID=3446114 RepID=UPI003EBFD019